MIYTQAVLALTVLGAVPEAKLDVVNALSQVNAGSVVDWAGLPARDCALLPKSTKLSELPTGDDLCTLVYRPGQGHELSSGCIRLVHGLTSTTEFQIFPAPLTEFVAVGSLQLVVPEDGGKLEYKKGAGAEFTLPPGVQFSGDSGWVRGEKRWLKTKVAMGVPAIVSVNEPAIKDLLERRAAKKKSTQVLLAVYTDAGVAPRWRSFLTSLKSEDQGNTGAARCELSAKFREQCLATVNAYYARLLGSSRKSSCRLFGCNKTEAATAPDDLFVFCGAYRGESCGLLGGLFRYQSGQLESAEHLLTNQEILAVVDRPKDTVVQVQWADANQVGLTSTTFEGAPVKLMTSEPPSAFESFGMAMLPPVKPGVARLKVTETKLKDDGDVRRTITVERSFVVRSYYTNAIRFGIGVGYSWTERDYARREINGEATVVEVGGGKRGLVRPEFVLGWSWFGWAPIIEGTQDFAFGPYVGIGLFQAGSDPKFFSSLQAGIEFATESGWAIAVTGQGRFANVLQDGINPGAPLPPGVDELPTRRAFRPGIGLVVSFSPEFVQALTNRATGIQL